MWERSNSILCHVTTRCLIACMLVLHLVRRIAALPAGAIIVCQRLAIGIASERWYLWGFIPCNAGLWSLGLYCWNKPVWRWSSWIMVRLFSYACFFFGFVLFLAGFWRFALILLLIRFLLWLDSKLQLDKPLLPSGMFFPENRRPPSIEWLCFYRPFCLAINKERMLDFTDPSDHLLHGGNKIFRVTLILRFVPVTPHLYPPAASADRLLPHLIKPPVLPPFNAALSHCSAFILFLYRTFLRPRFISVHHRPVHEFMFTIVFNRTARFVVTVLVPDPISI